MQDDKKTYSQDFGGIGLNNNDFYSKVHKRVLEMAELKGIILLFNTFGWTITIYAAFLSFFNVDVFTRSAFGFLGTIFLTVKIISFSASAIRKHKKENIEIRKLLNDEKERELKIRILEVDTYERETKIIKGFE